MSSMGFVDVASEDIETEVETSDMLILEPLQDHNYTSPQPNSEKPTTANRTKPEVKKLKKLPKITKLMALYNCKLCGFNTMNKGLMEAHRETHKGTVSVKKVSTINDSLKCPHCSFTTKTMSSLKVHIRVHTRGKSFKCTECDYSGTDIQDLIRHYKAAKTFCDFCTFSCHLKDKFSAHMKLHSGKTKVFNGKKLVTVDI